MLDCLRLKNCTTLQCMFFFSQGFLQDEENIIFYLLPSATKLGQGYVFTRVCDSVRGGGSQGPHPEGRLRGLAWGGVSRPTPRGEVEGSGWGGSPGHTWWGSASLHTGIYSLSPTATAAGGMHPTGMNSYIK